MPHEPVNFPTADPRGQGHRRSFSPRELFGRLNRPRAVEPQLLRTVCGIVFVVYVAVISIREVQPEYSHFFWIRLAVAFYCLIGATAVHRLPWGRLRAYTVILALVLSLSTGCMEAQRGNDPGDIVLTLLATFVTLLMLLTAKDLVLTLALLVLGHAVILEVWPPTVLPLPSVWGLLLGVMATGGIASLILSTQRVLMSESLESWEASRSRERTLQGFAEVVSEPLETDVLCSALADYVHGMIPEGHVFVLLARPDRTRLEIAAQTSPDDDGLGGLASCVDASAIPARLGKGAERRPLTGNDFTPEQIRSLARALGLPFRVRTIVVVPFPHAVPGMVLVVSADPQIVPRDTLVTMQTMANQAGVALAYAHAREEEQEQQERERQLVEERAAVAQMRNDFVVRASHEFRTPLALILTARDMLERYHERLTPEQRAQRLRTIKAGVQQITELLDDVLAIGRGEAGKFTCRREAVDLPALARELVDELRQTATSTHQLVVDCQEGAGTVRVDPQLTRRILRNLLGNAVKYSPDGGAIEVAVRCDDGGATIRVRDHGIGISAEDRTRLFEAFHRGQNVGRIAGTGLGLTIVKQAVDMHGGAIAVASEPDGGTTFEVHLPDGEPKPT